MSHTSFWYEGEGHEVGVSHRIQDKVTFEIHGPDTDRLTIYVAAGEVNDFIAGLVDAARKVRDERTEY